MISSAYVSASRVVEVNKIIKKILFIISFNFVFVQFLRCVTHLQKHLITSTKQSKVQYDVMRHHIFLCAEKQFHIITTVNFLLKATHICKKDYNYSNAPESENL